MNGKKEKQVICLVTGLKFRQIWYILKANLDLFEFLKYALFFMKLGTQPSLRVVYGGL